MMVGDMGDMGKFKFKLPKIKIKPKKIFKALKAPFVPFVSAKKKKATKQMAKQIPAPHAPHRPAGLPAAQNISGHVKEAVQTQGFPRWIRRASLEGSVWVIDVNPAAVPGLSEADILARIAAGGKMNPTEMMLVRVRMTRPMSQAEMHASIGLPGMGDLLLGRGLVGDAVFGAGIGLGLAVLLKKDAATWAGYGAGIGAAKHLLLSGRARNVVVPEIPRIEAPRAGVMTREPQMS